MNEFVKKGLAEGLLFFNITNERFIMKVTYFLSLVVGSALLAGCGDSLTQQQESSAQMNQGQGAWVRPNVVDPVATHLYDYPGASYQGGLDRLTKAPFDKDFILADINFNQKRWFTNFSGDISGRFIEVASDVSTRNNPWPEVLPALLDEVGKYQKEDGHFGIPVDWTKPIDFNPGTDQTVMMPILWGNGRMLLGLTAAAEKFGRRDTLETAKKLGDFYVNTVYPRFCDTNRMEEYRTEGQYASAYVTCVYEGMEGLLNLYHLTKDSRYLDTACKFADFHEAFDVVPVGHSHGSLGQTSMLVRLYDETGNKAYLDRAIKRWDEAVSGGFVSPAGSVPEKFWVKYNRDEGCTEGDWLRLNLLLWADTGDTKYLDMAERLYWNGILPNQWSTGGFGHRFIGFDDEGVFAYLKMSQESLWCCSFHVPWALHKMLSYLAVGSKEGIWYNFPMLFESMVNINDHAWQIRSNPTETDTPETVCVTLEVYGDRGLPIPPVHVRIPDWAQDVEVIPWMSGEENEKLDVTVKKSTVEGRNVLSVYTSQAITSDQTMKYTIHYKAKMFYENRKFQRIDLEDVLAKKTPKLNGVVVRQGPFVYMNKESGEIQDIRQDQLIEKMAPFVLMEKKEEPHAFVCNLVLWETDPDRAPAQQQ